MIEVIELEDGVVCVSCGLSENIKPTEVTTDNYPDGVTCNECGVGIYPSELPDIINAQITVTYNINEIRNTLAELNGVQDSEIKDHEIVNALYGLVRDDFKYLQDSVAFIDEHGEQLYL